VDIFAAAGLEKPDISILSDKFLAEVKQLPQRNLAVELLKKLINDQIRTHLRKNVVQARSFAEMLEQAIRKYQNRAIEAAQVIEELIQLAKDIRKAQSRGQELGLTDDEVAFYDALAENVEIDEQHRKLVGLMNDLYRAMREKKGREVLEGILDELVDYTLVHFGVEERYMTEFDYPGLVAHKAAHKKFADRVVDFHREFRAGQGNVTVELMRFLKDWLAEHIQKTDKAYSALFREHGVS